ncbi:hypothetical protein PSTG_09099 [Puccinia striiformis f. sp. tritici PST-78]|uniref:Uncharacterized protein n=1 Tax=Puccinia striiformis f. sp. tritici PST-78 TaxID=1165861 RepID=A0A0L0VEJ2_9BASI|nr:hypothetical protein PSTG_09099 [Puccinia striiformis f. sp. tritici PST-78]
MIPTNWRLSSSPEDDSDELERLQAFGRYSRRAGEAPAFRNHLPMAWRGSRPLEGTPDELERPQLVGIIFRRPGEAPGLRKLPDELEELQLVGTSLVRREATPTSWSFSSSLGSDPDGLERLQAVFTPRLCTNHAPLGTQKGCGSPSTPELQAWMEIHALFGREWPSTPATQASMAIDACNSGVNGHRRLQLRRQWPSTPATQASMAVHAFFGVDAVDEGRRFSAPL